MGLIASEEFAGLCRIMEQALSRGATPKMILVILERALRKVYRVRGGFSKRELQSTTGLLQALTPIQLNKVDYTCKHTIPD
jgi:hypothetical protein